MFIRQNKILKMLKTQILKCEPNIQYIYIYIWQNIMHFIFIYFKEEKPKYHWKDWCWSWSFNTLATWCEELTHWKRPWCWERLKAEGEGDNRGWDDWMASPTQWTWVWASSGSWWRTGKAGRLQSMELQRVRHNWVTELNWTDDYYWQI